MNMKPMDDSALREVPVKKESIYEGHILHVEKWTVTCPNGRQAPRELVLHKGAAAVIHVYPNGDTLLVRQYRVAADRITLEIPAGKLEKGEEAEICGRRELAEETGARAKKFVSLGRLYPSPGYCAEIIYMYAACGLSFGEQNLDEDEFLNVKRIKLEEAVNMVLENKITDAKTQAALLKLYLLRDRLFQ